MYPQSCFAGPMHDLSLRGHSSSCGNFQDLLHFRIESGDEILKHHMETASHAARYTPVRTQNEIVEIVEGYCNVM